jgi:hypothetical protein
MSGFRNPVSLTRRKEVADFAIISERRKRSFKRADVPKLEFGNEKEQASEERAAVSDRRVVSVRSCKQPLLELVAGIVLDRFGAADGWRFFRLPTATMATIGLLAFVNFLENLGN